MQSFHSAVQRMTQYVNSPTPSNAVTARNVYLVDDDRRVCLCHRLDLNYTRNSVDPFFDEFRNKLEKSAATAGMADRGAKVKHSTSGKRPFP